MTARRAIRCPVCTFVAYTPYEEVAHMTEKHPEVVAERLIEAGFTFGPDGEPIDELVGRRPTAYNGMPVGLVGWIDLYEKPHNRLDPMAAKQLCCGRVHWGDPIGGPHNSTCHKVQRELDPLVKANMVHPEFTIPDPLRLCTRCGERAAIYQSDGDDKYTPGEKGYYCGPCGRGVSIFVLPVYEDDLRQLAANAALERAS